MSINAVNPNYSNQTKASTAMVGAEQAKPDSSAEINQLNAEIEQAESELKETAKEVQKATGESMGGSSEKVQMLQNKMQMQQQAIMVKQMKIKEIETPSKATTERASADTISQPRMDQYIAGEDASSKPDNVYRMEEKDGTRTIVFNPPEK